MIENTIEVFEQGHHRVRIVTDENVLNPRRDYDHLVHVLTIDTHLNQYIAVDPDGGPLAEHWEDIAWRPDAPEIFARYVRAFHGGVVIEDRGHGRPVTLWYLTREDIEQHGITDPTQTILDELQEYRYWADGEVFGYVVEQELEYRPGRTVWDEVDSLYGLYGYAYAKEQAQQALKESTAFAA
ncbi:hypothetical protein [Streptomyces phage Vanseggelen]|uniref:Uncharacterized protein n=1 Tax=Streptomyces phage Vanseggelen TaxID=3065246 RepID=A0AA50ICW0_9CAUD|nr:hypothetical protein [Streptomyces phage Vanseggelen]